MAIRPRLFVEPPRYTPQGFGLLSVVQWVDETDVHWLNGIEFQPDSVADAHVTTDKCFDDPDAKTATDGIATRCANPVTVYAELDCGPVGHWDDFKARTVKALDNGQGRPLELAFWTGDTGAGTLSPHLAANAVIECQTAAVVVTGSGGPVPWQTGVALLETALEDCYGGEGVIHMPFWAAAVLLTEMYLTVVNDSGGPHLRTRLGTLVAAGSGYPGTGPDGAAPAAGAAWLYATGAIAGRQSPVAVTSREESLDRNVNSMVMIAERTFVFGWDACHFAVQVDLTAEAVVQVGTLTVNSTEAATTGTAANTGDTTVDSTAGGITLLAANANRKSALIQNTGTAAMRVTFDGSAPTTSHGFQLAAGATLSLQQPFVSTAAVKAIREGASSTTAMASETV